MRLYGHHTLQGPEDRAMASGPQEPVHSAELNHSCGWHGKAAGRPRTREAVGRGSPGRMPGAEMLPVKWHSSLMRLKSKI